MTPEEITAKIKQGLKDCSIKYQIEPKDIQVKIAREIMSGRMGTSEKIKCYVMKNLDVVKDVNGKDTEININDLLKINPAVGMLLSGYLKTAFANLVKNKGLDGTNVNARIFTTSLNFDPSIALYEGDRYKTAITVGDLTS